MDFYDVLDQVISLLHTRHRLAYRALKRQFNLNDEDIEALKDELIYSQKLAVDEDDRVLVWAGKTGDVPESASQPGQSAQPDTPDQPTPIERNPIKPHTPDSAERRQLTILFTDLVDSTKLSGQLDAEEYREVVRAYQATCSEVIERFGCFIAQTLGDGLLVYSGYPVASERDAENAVRTGLGIVNAIATLNERLERENGIRLAVRIGIHTGQCVIGEIRAGERQEQLALGEVPNVAARIQGLAEPDTVVISQDTHRLVEGYFDCEPLGKHDLKGISEPMSVYQVLRTSGAQNRLDIISPRGLTPLVGRESESKLLFERWAQAKEGQGQVVLLSGEAGIGKSRLIQVLKDHVSAEALNTCLECRSSPYFTNSALYPIIDMVQRTLRFQAQDTPEAKLSKLEQTLSQYRLPLDETVPLFATLLSLPVSEDQYPPLNWTPQRQRQKTLEAIVAITLELAEHQPVLFILEDAHWLDASTQEWLGLLIDHVPTSQVLTLITYRPEFQPSWSNRSYLTPITLNRLSHSQVEQLATQVAGGKTLPDNVIEQLADRTDGVPLYVEEMTKSVLESGLLKELDGRHELTGPVSSLAIPATLQDSLMARLDRLVTAKGIAQYASVIGRQFSYELLQAVTALDEATLQRELERLVDAELVYQRGLPPHATYTFKHALIQDIAYESLLRSARQGYHRRIAEVLEAPFPEVAETQPELLAHHYTEAGLHNQAITYWQQAGEKAVQRSAHVEAIGHLTKGLEIVRSLPATADHTQRELLLLTTLGPAFMATKGQGAPEAEHVYAQALKLCQQVGDTPQLFQVLVGLQRFYLVRGDYNTGWELGEQLLAHAQRQNDPSLYLSAHQALGTSAFFVGALTKAQEHFKQGIALYNTQRHHSHISFHSLDPGLQFLTYAAWNLWILGFPNQSRQTIDEALALVHELAHPFGFARALHFVACAMQKRREIQGAREYAEAAIKVSTEHGFVQWLSGGTMIHGWAVATQGQYEEGITQLRHGLAAWQGTGAAVALTYHLALLADVYCTGRQPDEGLRIIDEALGLVDKNGEHFHEAELYRLKGALLLQQAPNNAEEAASCFHHAISIAQHQSAKSWELRAATSLAKLWQSQGKWEEAQKLLTTVYGWFTEGFDTVDLKEAKALLVELEGERGE